MTIKSSCDIDFPITIPVVIIGGGACGMIAGLAAREEGVDVLILERDAIPQGSTALSSGLIPACGTKVQQRKNIEDSIELMGTDIQKKAKGLADPTIVETVCSTAGKVIDWLEEKHGIEFQLQEGFLYPGHSVARMHSTIAATGADLMGQLTKSIEVAGVDLMENAHVTSIYVGDDKKINGVEVTRPDGSHEAIGCDALIFACNGYGGNKELVKAHIPSMADALYFGHPGNQGDAVIWGQALGAEVAHMGACQGHGSVAHPHGILISWAIMMEGGIQINTDGLRFSNEHSGYSEQAIEILKQPDGIAWNIYDQTGHDLGLQFDDYRNAFDAGAVKSAGSIEELAETLDVPITALKESLDQTFTSTKDSFGRDFSKTDPIDEKPYYFVKVTGALFHTQGGLVIDADAHVLMDGPDRNPLPNLYAGGGAACGVSGATIEGYLSGNGLLTAVALGYKSGKSAAQQVKL